VAVQFYHEVQQLSDSLRDVSVPLSSRDSTSTLHSVQQLISHIRVRTASQHTFDHTLGILHACSNIATNRNST